MSAVSDSVRPHRRQPTRLPVPGILQARTLGWVAISFSDAWKWKVKMKSLSRVRLFVIPQTAAHQAPPSMGFSRQEYWSGVPLPSPVSGIQESEHKDLKRDLPPHSIPWITGHQGQAGDNFRFHQYLLISEATGPEESTGKPESSPWPRFWKCGHRSFEKVPRGRSLCSDAHVVSGAFNFGWAACVGCQVSDQRSNLCPTPVLTTGLPGTSLDMNFKTYN